MVITQIGKSEDYKSERSTINYRFTTGLRPGVDTAIYQTSVQSATVHVGQRESHNLCQRQLHLIGGRERQY